MHNDHLGTPQVVTNQAKQVVFMADYQPFGKLHPGQTNSIELYSRFPGQYVDSETGLYYNYFRDYDPSIGRYIESDPIGLAGGINTYAYVGGNPLSFVDPFGLWTYNGGGPFGPHCGPASDPKTASWIPDGGRNNTRACINHDKCYETCGKTKAQCDNTYLWESQNPIYYGFIVSSDTAQSAYDSAQKDSECKNDCK